jgi:5-methylcytosine-specific restriction endonuclease McrA
MSLGKAMIHARKQKSIAKAAALAGDHAQVQPIHMLQMPVLVLNASYEPINICGARRALVLVLKGIARTEEEHGLMLHAQRSRIAMPSVIRLLEYRRIPHQTRALSRKNILLRDRNTCQYCGVVLPSSELTLDHVVPRSRGGNSTWENLVACCHACNRRKGNRMLHEIDDMILLRDPRPFSLHTSRQIMRMLGRGDDRWRKYLLRFPDSTFVEDTAILTARGAVLTRPGAASREGEVEAIRPAILNFFPAPLTIEAPGTVDGGDICEAGEHFFIGLSHRTNEEGARQLAGHLQASDTPLRPSTCGP